MVKLNLAFMNGSKNLSGVSVLEPELDFRVNSRLGV
jgi:hypothetical protein